MLLWGGMMAARRTPSGLKPQWFQILLALGDQDLHGLEIMNEVLERTEGRMHLWPGQLYGSMKSLVDADYVVEVQQPPTSEHGGGRPRYYSITDDGRRVLVDEVNRLARFVDAARSKNLVKGSETP
jgi:DNA-binding PadR family transcriptional regulator